MCVEGVQKLHAVYIACCVSCPHDSINFFDGASAQVDDIAQVSVWQSGGWVVSVLLGVVGFGVVDDSMCLNPCSWVIVCTGF